MLREHAIAPCEFTCDDPLAGDDPPPLQQNTHSGSDGDHESQESEDSLRKKLLAENRQFTNKLKELSKENASTLLVLEEWWKKR